MLRRLRGRTHEVLTGLAVLPPAGGARTLCTRTRVTFRDFTEEELAAYLATGEPLDKAGAYGIQGTARCSSAASKGIITASWACRSRRCMRFCAACARSDRRAAFRREHPRPAPAGCVPAWDLERSFGILRRRNRTGMGSRFLISGAVVAALCVLSALYSGITGNPSPVTRVVRFVTTPVQRAASGIGGFFGKGLSYFTDFDALQAENEDLRRQLREMEQTVRDAELALEENARLRQQAGQPERQRDLTTVEAEVIARNPGDWRPR